RLPGPHLTHQRAPFPPSLTTTVFSQRSRRRFEATPRRAAPEGHEPSIFRAAPQSVTSYPSDLLRSTHTVSRIMADVGPLTRSRAPVRLPIGRRSQLATRRGTPGCTAAGLA